jgi:hypothetical protein
MIWNDLIKIIGESMKYLMSPLLSINRIQKWLAVLLSQPSHFLAATAPDSFAQPPETADLFDGASSLAVRANLAGFQPLVLKCVLLQRT